MSRGRQQACRPGAMEAYYELNEQYCLQCPELRNSPEHWFAVDEPQLLCGPEKMNFSSTKVLFDRLIRREVGKPNLTTPKRGPTA